MADTQRSAAELIALLADNSTGDISAQDLRDLVETLIPDQGAIFIDTTATAPTAITTPGTFELLAGGTLEKSNGRNFTMDQDGRLTYEGTATRRCIVWVSLSYTIDQNNHETRWRIHKTGVHDPATEIIREVGTGTVPVNITLNGHITIEPGDYIEVVVTDVTGTANITVERMQMGVLAVAI
jgi:hypothetical protein